ncbi:MAG: choice-of-anchor X domain-containing protein [Armatimonadota bacterium]
MKRLGFCFLSLALSLSVAFAQEVWQVVIIQPKEGDLFGWAQDAPSITIQAALQRKGEVVSPNDVVKRLFLTAQVFSGDNLLDNVPLWDDGTHGDDKAKDGIFTSTYRPSQTGEFRLRVRAQADLVRDGKVVTKEFWSDFVPIQVVPIPYPHLISPEPGSKTKTTVNVRARLLMQNAPFEQPDETLQAKIVAQAEGKKVAEAPLRRRGSVLTGQISLPKRGDYHLLITVTVTQQGKTLQAQSEPVSIQAVRMPIFWLIISCILFAVYLLLPPKEPPLRYRHRVRIGSASISLEPGAEKTIEGIKVKGASEKPEVTVTMPDGKEQTLQEGKRQQLAWREGEERKEVAVHYERAEPLRKKPSFFARLFSLTIWRAVFLILALLSLAHGCHQFLQIR